MTEQQHHAAGEGERWYIGAQNDGLFIIDRPPRPDNDHPVHEYREGISPTLAIPLGSMPRDTAQAIVDAHNASLTARPAAPEGEWVVVPLEWKSVAFEGVETYEAEAAFGRYRVFNDEDSAFGAIFVEFATKADHFCTIHAISITRVPDWDEAKAAAQSDYERRIRSALAAAPKPELASAVTEDMVEMAVQEGLDAFYKYRGDASSVEAGIRVAVAALSQSQPAPQPDAKVDEKGCYTLPNGDCVSEGPCIHTPPTEAGVEGPKVERYKIGVFKGVATLLPDPKPDPNGEWVKFTDHNTIVERLKEKTGRRVNSAYASMREDNDARRAAETALTTERERSARLREAATRIVDLYVQNQGTDSEFITCITPPLASEMTAEQRRASKSWSAFDELRAALRELKGGE